MTERANPVRYGLIEATTSLVISIFFTVVILALGFHQFGTDWSQRILVSLMHATQFDEIIESRAANLTRPPKTWVFVDVGPFICPPAPGRPSPCPPTALRTDAAVLASVVREVRHAGPRVVVLDISSAGAESTEPAAPAQLAETLREDGPPVLMAWRTGSKRVDLTDGMTPTIDVTADDRALLELKSGNVRYLPASIIESPGTSYLLPQYVLKGAGPDTRIPSLALGAALVAWSPPGMPFALLDGFGSLETLTTDKVLTPGCLPRVQLSCINAFARTERLMSFPILGRGEEVTEQATRTVAGSDQYLYLAPALTNPLPNREIKDALVIIGDSRRAANDQHVSALGWISGAELQLNEIRQFALASPAEPMSWLHVLLDEVPFYFVGFLAAFAVHALGAKIAWRRPPARHAIELAARRTLDTARTLIGVALLTAVSFVPLVLWIRPNPGDAPNFIYPFIALMTESIFELGQSIATVVRLGCHTLLLPDTPEQRRNP